MSTELISCCLCGEPKDTDAETATARSNVRQFIEKRFEVWRCGSCQSIHAADEVDLDFYYAAYPVHGIPLDWRTRPMFQSQHIRLRKAGLKKGDTVLDYGSGSGALIRYLSNHGHPDALAYDPYVDELNDPALLEQTYDCVISQDVMEHVDDPLEHAQTLGRLTKPGGIIAIGTPNASEIDLQNTERDIHALHQPYHRHILSRQALIKAGTDLGWTLIKYYSSMYTNTAAPFINGRFVRLMMRCRDDTLDSVLDPPSPKLLAYLPLAIIHGLFGSLYPPHTDGAAFFRR